MIDCIFCRVVAGELPSSGVASTERTYAFSDVNPAAPVHVLVVPRAHITDAEELGLEHGDLLAELFATARAAARATGLTERGYRMVVNIGEDSQNSVPHLHVHVLGGRRMEWPPG